MAAKSARNKNEAPHPATDQHGPSKASDDNDPDDSIIQMLSLQMVDSKYSWFVVFCSFFCNMIVDGMQYTFSNFLIPIIITFNSTTMAVSLIGSLMSGFYNFSGPLAGALANKFGFRMVTITGAIVAASGLSLSYFATDVRILFFTYGIMGGLGFGMIYMSAVITTSLYFDKYRALATSISVCGTGIGTFLFSPFGNWLVNSLGWRLALVVEGAIVLLCILFGLAFKPIEVFSFNLPVEEKDMQSTSMATIRTVKTIRDSVIVPNESRTLPNSAYPTLRQALAMQVISDEDGRRSLYSRSARASTVFSVRQSFVLGPVLSWSYEDEEEEVVSSTGYVGCRQKLQRRLRNYWRNFWHCRCHGKKELTLGDRPMYRDDVFYEGSLSYLRDKGDPINYHLSVIRVPDEKDAAEHRQQKICGCHEAMIRTLVTMTGVNLLKDKKFAFLCLSSFMYTMGVFIPYIFLRSLAESKNIEEEKSIWLVSSIGIANTAGRLFCGVLISCVRLNAAMLVFFCVSVSSLTCLIVLLPIMVESVFVFAVAFGFFTASFVSLRPVVIVQFLGLEKLTNAFGLVLLSQGIASIFGPPLAGVIDSTTGDKSLPILFAGSLLLVSASSILISTLLVRKK